MKALFFTRRKKQKPGSLQLKDLPASIVSGVFSLDEYRRAFARAASTRSIKILFKVS